MRYPRPLPLLILLASTTLAAQTKWVELGPAPIATGPYTGRVAAIAASRSNPKLYYVGGADGGVWKTVDAGVTWTPIGDRLPVTAIGALAVDPKDDKVLYVGMGEANFANHSRYGLGLAKTVDGGQTWKVYGAQTFGGRCFHRIVIDPVNPKVLYAAITHAGGFPLKVAARNHPGANGALGVFKSVDAGVTWTQLGGGLPTTLSATDVAINPITPRILYAAIGHIVGDAKNGVYKSIDGGTKFVRLGGGLPTTGVGRITLAVAPSNPKTVYASIVLPSSATGGSAATQNVYRSDNAGTSWTAISPGSYQATYGWYLCTSVVSPTDPKVILVGGLTCRRSTNSGSNWQTVTPPHVDLHAFDFDASGRLLCGNDGGIHRSTNLGSSWTAINGNLGLVQFYAGISPHPSKGVVVYGGTQDNGSLARGSGPTWLRVLGGDGGYTSMDATGARVFVEYQGTGNLYRSINGGGFVRASSGISGRNCFLPPHEVHPSNPLLMIYGTERLFRSTNGGDSWTAISGDLAGGSGAITGLAFAPSDAKTIYVGTNTGRVQVTEDAGKSWRLCLTGVFTWPRSQRQFAVHGKDPKRAFFVVGAFGTDQVRYTADAGRTWKSIDGNLPDVPTHTVAVHDDGVEPPILYVGTDRGVYRSESLGKWWELHGGSTLPNVPVIDLHVDRGRNRLLAATQGRGLWRNDLSLRSNLRVEQVLKPVQVDPTK